MYPVTRIVFVLLPIAILGCNNYANIPPNDIGTKLTPSGYEQQIYTPGQIDLGNMTESGYGNRLVLLQRSGLHIKEQFTGKENNHDNEDHRCFTADKAPMTLDVRLLFALPDYETPHGKKDLMRIFHLGNPSVLQEASPLGRVLRISAESVYEEQAQQQVRGKIRQICGDYTNFDTAFKAFLDRSEENLTKRLEREVADILQERNVPLRLINAYVSNMKPDPSVVEAIAAKLAADKRIDAINTLTAFLNADPTNTRLKVYTMQALQEIVSTANKNGHNTIIFANLPGEKASYVMPLPR